VTSRVSVGITTRDRPASLRRCVASLALAADLVAEALVFDDNSNPPASEALEVHGTPPVRIMRDESAPGYVAGRNRLVEAAKNPWVLLLDDDARLLDRDALHRAMRVLADDRTVAAVAFAQAEADGRPWPAAMQPSPAAGVRRVRSFIGFAHLLRRDVFLALGGYRELLGFGGEEKEYCLRLLDAGYSVVYRSDALVAHVPDRAGRNAQRYLRHVTRNDCLLSLLDDPIARAAWIVPARFALYFKMRRAWRIRDANGPFWIAGELVRTAPAVRRLRRPVSRRTLRRWRELGADGEPYDPPGPQSGAAGRT
jgi:GT2 family glycosyltransferase